VPEPVAYDDVPASPAATTAATEATAKPARRRLGMKR
jgi:hypothetical protein